VTESTDLAGFATTLLPRMKECISLVGGGGKTTLLFALGEQLPGTVVLSTTTKMGTDRTEGFVPLIDPSPAELALALGRDRVVLTWKADEEHRAVGYSVDEAAGFLALADYVILEADGSRRRPFKAPAAHEPVIPAATTLLLACVGTAALHGVISDVCHRPDEVAAVANCGTADRLTPQRLATVLTSPAGSMKDCPPSARFVVVMNQVGAEHTADVAALRASLDPAVELIAVSRQAAL
jgi:probable selenium-dependent hydroxylase accessory protein YqeC